MKKRKLGIIGGSGLYKMEGFEKSKWKKINTPWGKPSDEILLASLEKEEICFIPRHSRGHKINPTKINFRANIDAMKQLGVTDIISVSAVGSLKENLEPGKFVIVDQFIDRTFSRVKTFFDEEIVAHVSMAKPTSAGLSNCCEAALKKLNIAHQVGGTYVVMEGPQFSTLSESKLYRTWGADVIGMTNMPEAKLAREAEIRYSTVAMVTDYDCWHPDHDEVDVSMVIQTLMKNAANAQNMIKEIIKTFKDYSVEKDPANYCLDVAIITDPKLRTKKTIKKLKNIAGRVLNKKK
ncbi:S-methyl-5'-thioadenosine phosphorylase [Candidatus Pelagibacter bacterium]|nr:S-methyl-5'-thioadenosine phosphorylase [Candidatus Pelagibacter bacterium]